MADRTTLVTMVVSARNSSDNRDGGRTGVCSAYMYN